MLNALAIMLVAWAVMALGVGAFLTVMALVGWTVAMTGLVALTVPAAIVINR